MSNRRLTGTKVRDFLVDRTLECFNPGSDICAATITYFADGTCRAVMEDNSTDEGRYGFDRDLYWTQYSWFRDGGLFRFYLERIDDNTCQAFFEDGTKAFRQRIRT
ncbi:MAG: hypothetical protein AB8B85_10820 [Paracoccaceae bacterium]